MLLIFISWIYILFTTVNIGVASNRLVQCESKNLIETVIKGLFFVTLLASFWAFFGRINIEFHAFLLLINGVIYFQFKSEIKTTYSVFISNIKQLSIGLRLYLILISFLILAQCASVPFIIDNESYYIQTIKWLNEYGFVKGLANLHIFLGQTSGWHITQSVFNVSFLSSDLNDLSGFCLLLGNVFAILKLNDYKSSSNKSYLIMGLFPIANCLFFQLISAPSTDIPVYVFTFILFFHFLEIDFKNVSIKSFNWMVLLILYIVNIKVMSLGLLLIPIVVLTLNFKSLIKRVGSIAIISCSTLAFFIIKNSILSGFPLFPTTYIHLSYLDFAVPKEVGNYYFTQNKLYSFFITSAEFKSMTTLEIFIRWLTASKLNGILNSFTLLLFLVAPFFIYKYYSKKEYWILYCICLIQLILMLFSSPVYRFFIHFTFFWSFMILAIFIKNKKTVQWLLFGSLIPLIVVVFFSVNYDVFTDNKTINKSSSFASNNLLLPHSNSKLKMHYSSEKTGNLIYYSPINEDLFWITGNGKLPCVNKNQILFFKKYLKVYPQQRSNLLKDGFYSKKTNVNE